MKGGLILREHLEIRIVFAKVIYVLGDPFGSN